MSNPLQEATKWLTPAGEPVFDDTDAVGQSEYRAIYEVLLDIVEGYEGERLEDAMISTLSEFRDWSDALMTRIRIKKK